MVLTCKVSYFNYIIIWVKLYKSQIKEKQYDSRERGLKK